jgi:hypothetical protein
MAGGIGIFITEDFVLNGWKVSKSWGGNPWGGTSRNLMLMINGKDVTDLVYDARLIAYFDTKNLPALKSYEFKITAITLDFIPRKDFELRVIDGKVKYDYDIGGIDMSKYVTAYKRKYMGSNQFVLEAKFPAEMITIVETLDYEIMNKEN